MPVTSRADARSEIYACFRVGWFADADAATIPVIYEGKKPPASIELSETGEPVNAPRWGRMILRHNPDATGGQEAALAGSDGTRTYDREGIFMFSIFTTPGKGLRNADELGSIAQKAFQGKQTASGVWFRHVRAYEVGKFGDWLQTNVVGEFIYQEVT